MSAPPDRKSDHTGDPAPRYPDELDDRRMNAVDVAQDLGLSPVTVRVWCRQGRIAGATRQGRQWLVSLAAVKAMLANEPTLGKPRTRSGAPQRHDWSDVPEEASMDFSSLARRKP